MTNSLFFQYLCTLIGLLVAFVLVICHFDPFKDHRNMLFISIAVFVVLLVYTYIKAHRLSKTSNDSGYLGLVYSNFLVKLVITVAVPWSYTTQFAPKDTNFIIPYIVLYAVVTIFETYYLSKKVVFRR